jgi:hypothetical protein
VHLAMPNRLTSGFTPFASNAPDGRVNGLIRSVAATCNQGCRPPGAVQPHALRDWMYEIGDETGEAAQSHGRGRRFVSDVVFT